MRIAQPFLSLLSCLSLIFAFSPKAHSSVGIITGSKDNYISYVCRKAGEGWNMPALPNNSSYRVEVEFSIDSNGTPESCTIATPSGFDAFDLSACKALMRVKDFGTPPGRRPVLLKLEFSNARRQSSDIYSLAPPKESTETKTIAAYSQGKKPMTAASSTASAQIAHTGPGVISHLRPTISAHKPLKEYTMALWERIHRLMWIPDSLPEGRYDCTLLLKLDSLGNIVQAEMLVPTKAGSLDNIILNNARKASPLPAPPKGLGSRFSVPLSMIKKLR